MESLCTYPTRFEVSKIKPAINDCGSHQYLFKAEYLQSDSRNSAQIREGPNFFEAIFFIEGSGIIRTGPNVYEIKNNTIYRLASGQRYILTSEGHYRGYRICFSREFLYMTGTETTRLFLDENCAPANVSYSLTVSAVAKPQIEEVLQAMGKENTNNFQPRSQVLIGLLRIFLIYFVRLVRENKSPVLPGVEYDFFQRFTDLVKEHFTLKRTVAQYAADLHVTQNAMNAIVKKASGFNASHHIHQHIVNEAKQLAMNPNLSMKQIAYRLGFSDIGHFSKFFKNKSGMSFTDFKMNHSFNLMRAVKAATVTNLRPESGNEKKLCFQADFLESGNRAFIKTQTMSKRSKQFEIVWIKRGAGNFTLDFRRHEIKENMLYCLFPGQMYDFNPAPGISGYRICFSGDFFCHYKEQSYLPFAVDYQCRDNNEQIMQVDKEIENEIEGIVRSMIREHANDFAFKSEILKGLLKIFIAYFSRRFQENLVSDAGSNDIRFFRTFMDLLDCNYLTKKAVTDYAEALSVSPNYLSEVIKKVSGHSASYHIQKRLILEARRAAVYSQASMKEVAYRLGFLDPAQFSKFFKTKTGVNFSTYKKELTPFCHDDG